MQDFRSNEHAEKRMGLQSPLPQRLPYRPSPEPRSPLYSSVLRRTDEEALLFYTAAPTQRPESPAQLVTDPLAQAPSHVGPVLKTRQRRQRPSSRCHISGAVPNTSTRCFLTWSKHAKSLSLLFNVDPLP